MKKKDLKVYFLRLFKKLPQSNRKQPFNETELSNLFSVINALPVDLKQNPTRYLRPGTESEHCVLFSSDTRTLRIPDYQGYISGIFMHRRDKFPYQDDGEGNLQELQLSNDDNLIAEITYFLIDKNRSILIWVSNKYAGSTKVFIDYLNIKFKEAKNNNNHVQDILIDQENAVFDSAFIVRENSYREFNDSMRNLSFMELKITGTPTEIEQYYRSENEGTTPDNLINLKNIFRDGNCYSLKLILSVGHKKENLNKEFIDFIYRSFRHILKKDIDSFTVKGKIDEQTRTLDLLSDKFMYQGNISYEGRYPDTQEVFNLLFDSYQNYLPEIEQQIN